MVERGIPIAEVFEGSSPFSRSINGVNMSSSFEYKNRHIAYALGRSRFELMGDVYNRYNHEIMDMDSFARIVDHMANILSRQDMHPENCNIFMAAQCFVATCFKKQVPDSNMFDVFLGEEFQTELSELINVDYGVLCNAIHVGNVQVDLDALYANAR